MQGKLCLSKYFFPEKANEYLLDEIMSADSVHFRLAWRVMRLENARASNLVFSRLSPASVITNKNNCKVLIEWQFFMNAIMP